MMKRREKENENKRLESRKKKNTIKKKKSTIVIEIIKEKKTGEDISEADVYSSRMKNILHSSFLPYI